MVAAVTAYLCLIITLLAVATYAFYITYLTPVKSINAYISAKKTQTPWALGWCMFASGVGSWALYAFPDTAVQVGSWGIIGYWLSIVLGYAVLAFAGPAIAEELGDGVTLSDYAGNRFGSAQKFYVLLIALFYQLISIAAELTAIGSLMVLLAPDVSKTWAIILVSVITCAYTLFGGIKASIATDAVKGGFVLLLVVIICIAAFSYTTLPANAFESTGIASFTTIGFEAVFTLTIAVVSSNLFLTGFWLRTFAAKNDADLRKACAYAALASTPFIVLLGVVGFMGYIMHPEAPVFDGGFFFYILLDMPEGWSILVLIVVAALVSSTADTIQTGMSAEILSNFQDRLSLPFARVISIIINIPAIFIALTDTSVLKLFLIADLLCAATVGPIFLGIWNRTHPTAVLAGCVSGLLTIFFSGVSRNGKFVDGFNEFVLEEGLFTTHSMVLFILTLVIPVIVTVGLTFILPPAPKRSVPKNGNNELLVEAPVNHSSEHPYEASKSPAVV
ncbi:hypothetical protein H310_01193 [Aphanomyces invadans]|uniref:Solute:sodium symporter (SSS) family transporter n=1 Tax=Aphanomyces invadans TaxID=157072 RepID=A0A024UQD5_9STRA|nr:hypothetical protein H310_01193 [Aphanomyces invadans]ETW08661.1 hypothetical protein H310_01193 [Aphanomyces invadans]|eukprot:XP_008862466.1 hypothetical protein H310_01193 [Aphanomyces invadans]